MEPSPGTPGAQAVANRDVDGEAKQLKAIRDTLEGDYLGFEHRGLRFERRDLESGLGESAEANGLAFRPAGRPPQLLQFELIEDATGDEVGECSRHLFFRGPELLILHNQLKIRRRTCRGRGFATALLAANEAWYSEVGISAIAISADGDGSLFAARRGFDVDLDRYAGRSRFEGIPRDQLAYAAVDELLHLSKHVIETVEGDEGPRRLSVCELLDWLASTDQETAAQVERFRARIPTKPYPGRSDAFGSPAEIADFEADAGIAALRGQSLGRAALCHTGWSGIKRL